MVLSSRQVEVGMANFDFSSVLRSIATPAVSAPPVAPHPEGGAEEGGPPQEEEGNNNLSATRSPAVDASQDSLPNARDKSPTAQQDNNVPLTRTESGNRAQQQQQSREWLMGDGRRGGIATRLPIERHVKLEAPAWRDADNEVPQLAVRPVTTLKDPLGDKKIPLTQVAVNRR